MCQICVNRSNLILIFIHHVLIRSYLLFFNVLHDHVLLLILHLSLAAVRNVLLEYVNVACPLVTMNTNNIKDL